MATMCQHEKLVSRAIILSKLTLVACVLNATTMCLFLEVSSEVFLWLCRKKGGWFLVERTSR